MLYCRFETIPRQFPPTSTGPPSGLACAAASVARSRASRSAWPASPKPPGMRITDSARPPAQGLHDLRRGGRRHGDDREVDRLGQSVHGRNARHAVDRLLLRVHREQVPVGDAVGLLEVPEDDPARIHRVRGGADDGGALRGEELRDLRERDARTARTADPRTAPFRRPRPIARRRRAEDGLTSSSSRVGLPREFSGEKREKILGKGFEQGRHRRRARAAPAPGPYSFQRKSSAPDSSRLRPGGPASPPRAAGSRSSPPARAAPYHSVRRPPRPKTRTGPNAGSCLKERSASAAGVPEAGTSFSTTRIPRRWAAGARRETSSHIVLAAAMTDAGDFFENENPPTSDLWARSGETILRTTSSPLNPSRKSSISVGTRPGAPFQKTCRGTSKPAAPSSA